MFIVCIFNTGLTDAKGVTLNIAVKVAHDKGVKWSRDQLVTIPAQWTTGLLYSLERDDSSPRNRCGTILSPYRLRFRVISSTSRSGQNFAIDTTAGTIGDRPRRDRGVYSM